MLQYDFEESIAFWAHMVSRAFERALNRELAPHGITYRQWQVLGWLALEKELSQSQLADRLRIEPPTLVRILDCMERDGWIERRPSTSDRRKKLIRPTERVQPVWEQIITCARRVRAHATQGISSKDLATARRVLAEVQDNLLAHIPVGEVAS